MASRSVLPALALIALTVIGSGIAAAQPPEPAKPTAEAKAEAEKLFDEGRKLMMAPGKLDEGCRTLARSYELHNRGDTLLNLAECHRRQGKTATAHRELGEAIRLAEAVKFKDAIEVAKRLRDELGAQLSQLTVQVPAQSRALKDLAVELNGEPLPAEKWDQPLTLDPASYTMTASAAGYKPFSATVQLGSQADRQAVAVVLEPAPAEAKPQPAKPAPAEAKPQPAKPAPAPAEAKPQPKPKHKPRAKPAFQPLPPAPDEAEPPAWIWISGGIGAALIGASIGFGIDLVIAADELNEQCGEERSACPAGYDFDADRARELRDFGLFVGLGAAGVVAVGAAVVGIILAPSGEAGAVGRTSPLTVAPWASTEAGGLGLRGSF